MADDNSSPDEGNLDPSNTTDVQDTKTDSKTDAKTAISPDTEPVDKLPSSDWPEDWRNRLAGEDDKALKRLARFKAPADLYKSYLNIEKRMSSGEFSAKLGKDATPEDVAAWRKENGIPEKFDEYYKHLGDLVIGDEDKPIFDDFFENVVHKNNLPPDAAKAVAQWYYDYRQSQQDATHKLDLENRKETEDSLREEWGPDFRPNINAVTNLVSRFPEEVRENFMNARLPNGQALFNNKDFLSFMVEIERDLNPASTLLPNTTKPGQGVDERIAEIERFMRSNRREYNRDERMQSELRQLYEAREKLQARGSA